jgi:hypothetical protein
MGGAFLRAFTADLISLELPELDGPASQQTRVWVLERIDGADAPARLGMRAASGLLALVLAVIARRPYPDLPEERRRALAARLAATSMTPAAELVRAVRALAVSYAYEQRFARAA